MTRADLGHGIFSQTGEMVDAFACFGGRESSLLSLMDDSGDADVSGVGGPSFIDSALTTASIGTHENVLV